MLGIVLHLLAFYTSTHYVKYHSLGSVLLHTYTFGRHLGQFIYTYQEEFAGL